jgi:DNA-binding transcriptional LysR family regulator
MKRNLDIHLLRTFTEVALSRSFTAAAGRLYLTQSAVSAHIRRLETQVGLKLLERNNRRVKLTDAGATLYDHAQRILALNDEALGDLDVSHRVRGAVRLGIPSDYAAHLLPRVLERFGQQYPEVQIELFCELSVDLLGLLHQGRLDLALVTRQPNSSGGDLVRREGLVWAGARDKQAHMQDPLPLALFPPGFCIFRESALAALREIGRPWRLACTSRSLSGIRAAVSAGLAVSVVAEHTLSQDMCVLHDPERLPPLPEIELALHTSGPGRLSPQAGALARFLQETLGQDQVL